MIIVFEHHSNFKSIDFLLIYGFFFFLNSKQVYTLIKKKKKKTATRINNFRIKTQNDVGKKMKKKKKDFLSK